MEAMPVIYVDWNDDYGNEQIGLDCRGSQEDIQRQGVTLCEGLRVKLYGDELEAEAIIKRHAQYKTWVAEIVSGTPKDVPLN